ncbi:hypothetical protein SAMN02927937_00114 [Paenimyroides aquimaris]|uniref:Lipoprotein n=1 Tax=Paenimyroides marinum TaxID=1159016 RepID=A0A1H6J4R8_9FLAO|nr:hypothetical protein [Paenimyroides aquimaris]SEH54511.1 hypothetical protein SAMN02927937_00114 [Paenimyroides aquimaris]
MNKVKHLAFGITGALLVTAGLISCDNDEVTAANEEKTTTELQAKENSPFIDIGIAKWDWHRASKDCKKGFGICNGEWFPNPNPPIPPITTPTLPEPVDDHTLSPTYMILSSENLNEDNELSFDVYINEEVDDPNNVIPLIIDEDIHFSDPEGTVYTIKSGIYNYDINIGEYGGYSIN